MKYKNYIFDLYGTLIDIRTDEWAAQLWKKMAILYGYYGANYTYKELGKAYGELVDKVVRMAKLLGRQVATSDEAREILSLKPRK